VRKSSLPHQPSASQEPSQESLGAALPALAEELVYRATPAERRLKARFWAALADNPLVDPKSVTLEQARSLTSSERLAKLWPLPGFRDWFLNSDEHRARLEYLFDLALDAAEQVLTNEDPKAQSARVNMVKVIGDLAGKFPRNSKSPEGGLAGAIGQMDRAQLEAYLTKQGVTLQLTASKGVPPVPPSNPTIIDATIIEDKKDDERMDS
jgi:hypothetical protein